MCDSKRLVPPADIYPQNRDSVSERSNFELGDRQVIDVAGNTLHHKPKGLHEYNKLGNGVSFTTILDLLLGWWDERAHGD